MERVRQGVESKRIELISADFKDVHDSSAFVDKTMFLNHFMRDEAEHMVITAPKGFGKTSILNMVSAFLNIPTDEAGNPLNKTTSEFYSIFTSSVKIAKYPKLINANYRKFPVLALNFNEIDTRDEITFSASFRSFLQRTFSQFPYLERSKNLTSVDKFKLSALRRSIKNLELSSLIGFGKILTRMLFEHFKTKCVLLVDDYDVPFWRALEAKNSTEANSIIKNLALFIGRLVRTNGKHVARSFLTGCRKVAAKHLTTADNLQYYCIFDESPYWEFYGFTEDEIEFLRSKFNISAKSLGLDERDSVFDGNRRIYNTSSVLRKIKEKSVA
nr:PREDICTED: uncharacterized protein LOC109033761 isoform X2 [Bemisia tabaci]